MKLFKILLCVLMVGAIFKVAALPAAAQEVHYNEARFKQGIHIGKISQPINPYSWLDATGDSVNWKGFLPPVVPDTAHAPHYPGMIYRVTADSMRLWYCTPARQVRRVGT